MNVIDLREVTEFLYSFKNGKTDLWGCMCFLTVESEAKGGQFNHFLCSGNKYTFHCSE